MLRKIISFAIIFAFHTFYSKAVMIYDNTNYDDTLALNKGQTNPFTSVCLILTKAGNGSGIFIDLPDRPELRGKVILTAAHVIDQEIKMILMDGLKPEQDEEDDVDQASSLSFDLPIKHPQYKDAVTTRQYDFGLIILKNPIENIIPLTLAESSITQNDSVLISGFGQKIIVQNDKIVEQKNDLKRRVFETIITDAREPNLLLTNMREKGLAQKYVFPYYGDSGGGVFKKNSQGNINLIGIVSGFDPGNEQAIFISPHINDLYSLLT